MKRTGTSWPALGALRSLRLTAALAGMALIGLTLAGCGGAGSPARARGRPRRVRGSIPDPGEGTATLNPR